MRRPTEETQRWPRTLKEVVALLVDPPVRAVVLSIDEKSQIQALDRTHPGWVR
jgi:hypothetical protein